MNFNQNQHELDKFETGLNMTRNDQNNMLDNKSRSKKFDYKFQPE